MKAKQIGLRSDGCAVLLDGKREWRCFAIGDRLSPGLRKTIPRSEGIDQVASGPGLIASAAFRFG